MIDLDAVSCLFCKDYCIPYTLMIREYPSIIDRDMPPLDKLDTLMCTISLQGLLVQRTRGHQNNENTLLQLC